MTISVLIADDEQPAIDELAFLLGQDPRIGVIHQAASGAEAIRLLTREPVDAAFLDIHMPGLNGFDLARAMAALRAPPRARVRHRRRGGRARGVRPRRRRLPAEAGAHRAPAPFGQPHRRGAQGRRRRTAAPRHPSRSPR